MGTIQNGTVRMSSRIMTGFFIPVIPPSSYKVRVANVYVDRLSRSPACFISYSSIPLFQSVLHSYAVLRRLEYLAGCFAGDGTLLQL